MTMTMPVFRKEVKGSMTAATSLKGWAVSLRLGNRATGGHHLQSLKREPRMSFRDLVRSAGCLHQRLEDRVPGSPGCCKVVLASD